MAEEPEHDIATRIMPPIQYSTRVEGLGYLCDCLCGHPKITSGESNLTVGASQCKRQKKNIQYQTLMT